MNQSERVELEKWIELAWDKAIELGLNPFPTHFEVVPDHIIYELGAYGLPARFSHWTFGRDYHRQKTSYEYGLSRIYEIVFNTNPTEAFLLESNSLISHKLVVAHVLGHSDFFRNNLYFEQTDRQMVEKVRLHAERIRGYEAELGTMEVEDFVDRALTIEQHFDPSVHLDQTDTDAEIKKSHSEYEDLWRLGQEQGSESMMKKDASRKLPSRPHTDLLRFIAEYARDMRDWQRDVLQIVREEMIYFYPQMRTKIMNEGWASYWHEKILSELPLSSDEHLEFRRMHASVLSAGSRMSMNPYHVGYQILKDIERRWNGELNSEDSEEDWRGEKVTYSGASGLEKIFEVRRSESDVSFLRKYLTARLVRNLDLYTYHLEEENGELRWVVTDTDWRHVRDALVDGMTNMGVPVVWVEDGDYQRRGELFLRHAHDGKDLDADYTSRTLRAIESLWGRPVHLETVVNGEKVMISCTDNQLSQVAV